MTAIDFPTVPLALWVSALARLVGAELGRLVVFLAADALHLAWGIGRTLAALRWALVRLPRVAVWAWIVLELALSQHARTTMRRELFRAQVVKTTKGTRK